MPQAALILQHLTASTAVEYFAIVMQLRDPVVPQYESVL